MKCLNGVVLALALAVGGCGTSTINTPVGAVSLKTADEKAMIAMEGTYRAVLIAVNAAVDSGALKGANAATASRLLAQANTAVRAARTAYDTGNSVQMAARLTDATAALSGVRAIIGR